MIPIVILAATATLVQAEANIFCESGSYKGKEGNTLLDDWCQASCTQDVGFIPGACPGHLCECGDKMFGADTCIGHKRVCPTERWIATPDRAATDFWCTANCSQGFCPCSHCYCDPCGEDEEFVTLTFDEAKSEYGPVLDGYGLEWDNAAVIDPGTVFGDEKSGYGVALVTPRHVLYNSWGHPMTLTVEGGKTMRLVWLTAAAAWAETLTLTIETSAGESVSVPLSPTDAMEVKLDLADAASVKFSTEGSETGPYNYFGNQVAIDNVAACLPKGSLAKGLTVPVLKKRAAEEDPSAFGAPAGLRKRGAAAESFGKHQ